MEYPKAINCRLGADDMDIKIDLASTEDKTARIKDVYRLGLQFEAMCKSTHAIPDEHLAVMYRIWIEDLYSKRVEQEKLPTNVLYTING